MMLDVTRTTPSFDQALADFFQRTQPDLFCTQCGLNRDQTLETKIIAAPQILKISLQIFRSRFTGKRIGKNKVKQMRDYKVNHTLQHPDVLDLTDRQLHNALPLRYRLSSVISHSGTGLKKGGGHYVASARGPGGQVRCISDSAVQNFTQQQFLASPQDANIVSPGSPKQVYILTYVREKGGMTSGQRAAARLL
jgi:ubiquitin C-terminal hydrolase